MKFRFHWKGGKPEVGEGNSVADAFRNLGYGGGALAALDHYEEIKEEPSPSDEKVTQPAS